MNPAIVLLITVFYAHCESIVTCAVKFSDRNKLPTDAVKYYLEAENREFFHSNLPEHIRTMGPVVHVEEIDGAHEVQL